MARPCRRRAICQLILAARREFAACRMVVTSRDGAEDGLVKLEGFATLQIPEFTSEQVKNYLGCWGGCMGKTGVDVPALLARVSVQPLVEIATNPLMLTAIAVIYWNGKKLPERRAELYETILLWLAESRDHKRKGRLDAAHSLRVLGTLALALQRTRRGQNVEIGLGDAAGLILGDFKDGPEAAETFLEQELTDSGIIIGRGRNLKFWHRTFQEYLAGWKLSYDFDPNGPF